MRNVYVPVPAKIIDIKIETRDVKTYRLVFEYDGFRDDFSFSAGQFVEFSVPAVGESTFCIASAPDDKGYIECSVKKVGKVTEAIHMLEIDNMVGIRGPYGNCFPIEDMKDKDVIFVGGGIGLAPLRSLIRQVLSGRENFKKITIIYGARSVQDLVYKVELEEWQKRADIKTVLTVDPGGETADWKGRIGFIPSVLEEVSPSGTNSIVITCGPPIMIKFVLLTLDKLGFAPEQILTTLEMKMKCGVGQCGRCNVGNIYVCKDGPVFTYSQIKEFIEEIN